MKKLTLLIVSIVGAALMIAAGQAGAVQISLVPSIEKIHAGETLYVGIDISGLHSGGTDSLLGGWTLDIGYDPGVLQPTSFTSVGPYLGSITQGEAMDFPAPDFSVAGVVTLGELSLLPIDNYFDTIWKRGLGCVQRQPQCDPDPGNGNPGGPLLDSFRLGTVAFQLANTAMSSQFTDIGTANIVLSDGNGDEISVANYPSISVEVSVPEPSTLFLLVPSLLTLLPSFAKRGILSPTNTQKTLF